MLLLIVTIGMLNVCLGFGLAMYYGYGPPGLDGIFQSLGPLPRATPNAALFGSGELGAPYVPLPAETIPQSAANPVAAAANVAPAEPLAEEGLLDAVREMATAAETTLVPGAVRPAIVYPAHSVCRFVPTAQGVCRIHAAHMSWSLTSLS